MTNTVLMLISEPGNQARSRSWRGSSMIPQLIRIRPTATIRLAACPNIVSLLTNSSYERIPATRLCKKIVRDREWFEEPAHPSHAWVSPGLVEFGGGK